MKSIGLRKMFGTLLFLTAGSLAVAGPSTAPSGSRAEQYFDLLDQAIASTRRQMPQITASAQQAAKKILAGGTLWAAGRQPDFFSEACGRAGGLMGIKALGDQPVTAKDVVLYAVPGTVDRKDKTQFEKWRMAGAEVTGFFFPYDAGPWFAGNIASFSRGLSLTGAKGSFEIPIDTVANVINLWAWTGEFAAACARAGKMPIFYKTIGLPGGRERIAKYNGKVFHDDLKVKPVAPGVLGRTYLDQIQSMLKAVRKNELPKIRQAAAWWNKASADKVHILVMGHMFPQHFKDTRVPQKGFANPADQNARLVDRLDLPRFVFYVGYQYPPQPLIAQAVGMHFKLAYLSVQPGKPAEPAKNVLYINPHWPLDDACVEVPGYDISILPASGILDAAIYWSTLAETCR